MAFSWEDPVYGRNVALMGEGGLQSSFDNEMGRYNRAYQDWLQTLTARPEAPQTGGNTIVGSGPPHPDHPFSVVGDPTGAGLGPPHPDQPFSSVGDPTGPGFGPPHPDNPFQVVGDISNPNVVPYSFSGSGGNPTPPPGILPHLPQQADLERLKQQTAQYREQNQSAYADQMGGGWAGGVYPSGMLQTFQEGGEFNANPTSGVRPTNPFAPLEQASYGRPGQQNRASYGGLGGLGGVGGADPFTNNNPYAPR